MDLFLGPRMVLADSVTASLIFAHFSSGRTVITDQLSYHTDQLSYHTDQLSYHTDQLSYHTDQLLYHTDQLSYLTDEISYHTDELSYHTDELSHCKAGRSVALWECHVQYIRRSAIFNPNY